MFQTITFTLYFFLVILSYYQVKPYSRSLIMEAVGREWLPYIWVLTSVTLFIALPFYESLLRGVTRRALVRGTLLAVTVLSVLFWIIFNGEIFSIPYWGHALLAVVFYLFVDILSVLLVEQFWSVANSSVRLDDGKRWYGIVASGGLIGSMVGGWLVNFLLAFPAVTSEDLLLSASVILLFLWGILGFVSFDFEPRQDSLRTQPSAKEAIDEGVDEPSPLPRSRWSVCRVPIVQLLLALVFFSQILEPLVEYVFLAGVDQHIPKGDSQTIYIAAVYSTLSMVALAFNLFLAPLIFRIGGAFGGIIIHPLAVFLASLGVLFSASLPAFAFLKIFDRGASYSIARASKELLYLKLPEREVFSLKALIDMFGYRAFKVLGSVLIVATSFVFQEDTFVLVVLTHVAALGWLVFVWFRRGAL